MNYLLLSVDDAREIVQGSAIGMRKILDRLKKDTGGDLITIATVLKNMPVCAACRMEGVACYCYSLDAQKIGRRLYRLIERANK